jgi:hypothetical protein
MRLMNMMRQRDTKHAEPGSASALGPRSAADGVSRKQARIAPYSIPKTIATSFVSLDEPIRLTVNYGGARDPHKATLPR